MTLRRGPGRPARAGFAGDRAAEVAGGFRPLSGEDAVHDPSLLVLSPGTLFHARYRVVRSLAAGGMGAVDEVVDDNPAGPRALKVIPPARVQHAEAPPPVAPGARGTRQRPQP